MNESIHDQSAPPAKGATAQEPPKKVAVIVVHGVGTSPLGETARGISGLLLRLRNEKGLPVYSQFEENPIQFPASELPHNQEKGNEPHPPRKKQTWDSRNYDATHLGYIQDQLEKFVPQNEDETFSTIRIKSKRTAGGPEVDLYEMYWADICRGGNGFLRFFIELYQLFFHLGSLGERTVHSYATMIGFGTTPLLWKPLTFSISLAYRWLSRTILFFNIAMIIPTLIMVLESEFVLHRHLSQIGMGLLVISCLLLLIGAAICWVEIISRKVFLGLITVAIVLASLAGCLIYINYRFLSDQGGSPFGFILVSLVALLLTAVPSLLFVEIYERSHPSSRAIGWTVGLSMSAVFAVYGYLALAQPEIPQFPSLPLSREFYAYSWMAVHYFLFATLVAIGCTAVLLLLEIAVFVSGLVALGWAIFDLKTPAFRVFVTALFGLSISTVALNILGVTIWSTVYLSVSALHGQLKRDVFAESLLGMGTIGSGGTLIFLGLFLFVALFILLPSLLHEIYAPQLKEAASTQLGWWLTVGGGCFNICIFLLFLAAIAPCWSILDSIRQMASPSGDYLLRESFSGLGTGKVDAPKVDLIHYILALLGFMGIGFFALKNGFDSISVTVGSVVDRVLDVDEYLRESPETHTPKARIFCRYHALMRALYRGRPDEPGYDRVIIFAHSQGSVVSGDYLRYLSQAGKLSLREALQEEKDTVKSIHLFTMGNPLRQLYGWRFPAWYDWAWKGPRLSELKIDSWSNIFGSGDYVGRSLWKPIQEMKTYLYQPPTKPWQEGYGLEKWEVGPNEPGKREKCLGNAAHTHYWDTANKTGSEVCLELDRLITAGHSGDVSVVDSTANPPPVGSVAT